MSSVYIKAGPDKSFDQINVIGCDRTLQCSADIHEFLAMSSLSYVASSLSTISVLPYTTESVKTSKPLAFFSETPKDSTSNPSRTAKSPPLAA